MPKTKPFEGAPQVQRVLVDPGAPPLSVNYLGLTRVGNETQMDVGFLDLPELGEHLEAAREAATAATVPAFVVHRLVLGPKTLEELVRKATAILDDLRADG